LRLTMTHHKLQKLETTISKRTNHGLMRGYRSGLEDAISRQIEQAGLPVIYEEETIKYVWPERNSTYRPDFKLPKKGGFFLVESKGRFVVEDRQKHLLIKEQHPDIDIRFVFSNCNQKLYKGSPTSYADWCEKHGFVYANKRIPEEWLKEGADDVTE